ncbi:MAG: hypothetical protein CL983_01135 [Euryarchaeota archaeon]|nr:hypothetical protein [Euryarchaeota archaeon]|tara:strand:+ start:540 stop:1961 length:1422 start_codon:yes stop_codon:yes gene_type:complete
MSEKSKIEPPDTGKENENNDDLTRVQKNKKDFSKINLPSRESMEIKKYKRELRRTRNSASFRIGNTIISRLMKPWKIITIPFALIGLSWRLVGERLGKIKAPYTDYSLDTNLEKRKAVVFFPTNGVGFGHFTRLLAIGTRIKKLDPTIEVIFFTTMPTLHILKEQGKFIAYHIPGKKSFDEIDPKSWNTIIEEMLSNVLDIHQPSMFVFDGTYPYRGMLNSINTRKKLNKMWLRRRTFKKNSMDTPIETINCFDSIISPKDSLEQDFSDEEKYNSNLISCNPIILLDKEHLESRKNVLLKLGIPFDSTVVYVQLGAGNINDINSELGMTIDALSNHENVFIVLGESMIGKRLNVNSEKIRIIRDYPNSRFFNAFDFAIMAAGYNSYHEAINFNLPTIFYPNLNTGKDDQLARAKIAEMAGAMVVIKDRTPNKIAATIERMCDLKVRKRMIKNMKNLQTNNGADQLAKYIVDNL